MRSTRLLLFGSLILLFALFATAAAQNRPASPKTDEPPKSGAQPDEDRDERGQDIETVRINTNLVTVPVIASDRGGLYVSDLRKEEFSIFEDGVKQEVSFFATVSEPFHVVLLLDTSASTKYKLKQIQDAAIRFTEELQSADRVKVISFDAKVSDLCDFSNDRSTLRSAIKRTLPGTGTRLYDAMRLAFESLKPIKGRKAIVLFTDGVDWHSDSATYAENRRTVEESGVIVYPIRYNTRADTERIARQQSESGEPLDLGVIFGGQRTPRGTTPPTFPGEEPSSYPTGTGKNTSRLPSPDVIFGGSRPTDPRSDPGPDPRGDPKSDPRTDRRRDPRGPRRGEPIPTGDTTAEENGYPDRRREPDTISEMLDAAFKLADDYLNEMADKSGGKLVRADTLYNLPEAFAEIAAELRTQYSLGYYPANAARDGKYHKIQVKTNRKDIAVRARPGYRTPSFEPRRPRR